ncbi:MAG: rod shape-determining protein MreC [Deltaproteobacteria bacterium]|nr:rod shape-determining protein MreC [Deltaproteobacteria bacterium]
MVQLLLPGGCTPGKHPAEAGGQLSQDGEQPIQGTACHPRKAETTPPIDQNSAVDCLTQESRDRGMVKGLSTDVCRMDYMAKSSDVTVGDTVITSGLGGIFPKGLPVGRISKVKDLPGELFKGVEVTPSVDFSKLEEVLVIRTGTGKRQESD